MADANRLLLHYHPFTRSANVVWTLEELGRPYDLHFVDIRAGAHKEPEFLAQNPMGKLPTLVDGDTVVSEAAAIAIYLGDRYASGRLAPALDDPARAAFLRWCFFAPSVIEPGCYARAAKWEYRAGQAGWGTYESMLSSIEHAIGDGPFLLGETFSMADVVFGGMVRFMLQFKMLEPRPSFVDYVERLNPRPAYQAAQAINQKYIEEHGLGG